MTRTRLYGRFPSDAMAVGAAMGRSAARWKVEPGLFHAAWHGGVAQRPCVPLVDAARLLLAVSLPTAAPLVGSRTQHDLVTRRAGRSAPSDGCLVRRLSFHPSAGRPRLWKGGGGLGEVKLSDRTPDAAKL